MLTANFVFSYLNHSTVLMESKQASAETKNRFDFINVCIFFHSQVYKKNLTFGFCWAFCKCFRCSHTIHQSGFIYYRYNIYVMKCTYRFLLMWLDNDLSTEINTALAFKKTPCCVIETVKSIHQIVHMIIGTFFSGWGSACQNKGTLNASGSRHSWQQS